MKRDLVGSPSKRDRANFSDIRVDLPISSENSADTHRDGHADGVTCQHRCHDGGSDAFYNVAIPSADVCVKAFRKARRKSAQVGADATISTTTAAFACV